jgi:hypothetical protein
MGLLNLFGLGKKVVEKRIGVEPVQEAVSNTLPFKAKVGSFMGIQKLPFIRAQTCDSLVEAPGEGEDRIVAISQMPIGEDRVVRYFLQTEETSDCPKFVQFFQTKAGEVQEAHYYAMLTTFVPTSTEEQALFTGRNGEGLGQLDYSLSKEQLSFLPEEVKVRVFGEKEDLAYIRNVGGQETFVAPFEANETRVEDNEGNNGLHQLVYFTPYVRQLSDGTDEHLLICTNIVSDEDGFAKRKIEVRCYVGMAMDIARIEVV